MYREFQLFTGGKEPGIDGLAIISQLLKEMTPNERNAALFYVADLHGFEITPKRSREAHNPRTVTHIPDSSGLTLPQLEAGKQALYSCSEDPSFDDVRAVIAAVAQSNPTK